MTLPPAHAQPVLPDADWTILAGFRGSHAHGTAIEPDDPMGTDDVDLMAVVVPPPSHYLGLDTYGSRGTREVKDGPYDVVAYEARKFVSLLAKGNPNVLGLLWLDNDRRVPYGTVSMESAGLLLRTNREPFTLTKQTIRAHLGYAQAQRAKMEASPTAQAYMGERRRALAERFGYDTKHAAHMLRLLWNVVDLMDTGRLRVHMDEIDSTYLKEVKRGEWDISTVFNAADEYIARARRLEAKCSWPDRVDPRFASDLCAEVVRTAWRERGETA